MNRVATCLALVVVISSGCITAPPAGDEGTLACKGSAACFAGTVTKIVDGDTLDVGDTRVRLALTNTPEWDEPGYDEAAAFAASVCPPGSAATVDEDDGQTGGSYGRVVAVVHCGGRNLNEELLETGHARILTEYCGRSEFRGEPWAREFGC